MATANEDATFIVYYIFSALAIVCNLGVLIYLKWKYPKDFLSKSNPFLRLVILLHISNIGECITLIPYIFQFNHDFCVFMEAVKYYFGLMNLFVIFILVQAHRYSLLYNVKGFSQKIRFYTHIFVFLFPLISLLPFADGVYIYPAVPWCSLPSGASIGWALCIQFLWVWGVILSAIISNVYMLRVVLIKNNDKKLFQKYAFNCGAFSLISGLSWIPRSWAFFQTHDSIDQRFVQYFPALSAAILYCVLFMINENGLIRYESETSKSFGEDIIWDTADIFNIIDQTNATRDTSISVAKSPSTGGTTKNPFLLRPSEYNGQRSFSSTGTPTTQEMTSISTATLSSITTNNRIDENA